MSEQLIYKFGVPKHLVTGQGTEFANMKDELIRHLGINRITTTPAYNSRSNGDIERRWRRLGHS